MILVSRKRCPNCHNCHKAFKNLRPSYSAIFPQAVDKYTTLLIVNKLGLFFNKHALSCYMRHLSENKLFLFDDTKRLTLRLPIVADLIANRSRFPLLASGKAER